MYKTLLASTLILALFSGCDDSISSPELATLPAGYTVFDIKKGDIPYPNNLLFAKSTDGTLNIPYDPESDGAIIKKSLNTLDGFSTIAPISVGIDGDIDPLSLATGLEMYKVQAFASAMTGGIPAVTAIEKRLVYGLDYYATTSSGRIVVLPLKPLDSNSNYMIILNKNIVNKQGQSLHPDAVSHMLNSTENLIDPTTGKATVYLDPDETINNETAMKLEGLRKLNQAMFMAMLKNDPTSCSVAPDVGVKCDDVVMAWSFKTQTIGKIAKAFADEDLSGSIVVQPTGMTSKDALIMAGYDVNNSMKGIADLYMGMLKDVPYYLGVAENNHSQIPLTQYFETQAGTDLPKQQAMQDIPLLMTVPNHMDKPSSGWPVVIFQHGITKDRTMLLPVSEAFAAIGYVAVAIDLPLHGITNPESPLRLPTERTFDLDIMNNETNAPGPDGIIDMSGIHYINLANPLVSRDNLRQSTSDLIALKNAISSTTGIDLDDSKIAFVGHSLGTIASFGFLANADTETTSLAMPGGGIAQLLNNSKTFGPIIKAGLAAKGLKDGTPEYEAFMIAVQTLIDDGDSINYATAVKERQAGKLFAIKVIGDKVIPNAVATAPLSGTNPLLNILDAQDINTSAAPGLIAVDGQTKAEFTEGDHGSILSPEASPKATVEMQTEVASFVQSLGTLIKVQYPDIIKQ